MTSNFQWHNEPWHPSLDWSTPTGQLLQQAVEALLKRFGPAHIQIVVFGSSPLQMGITKSITSGDLDIASDQDIEEIFQKAHLSKGQSSPYVEVCSLNTFRTASDWRDRAYVEARESVEIVFPHPIDILVSKVPRGEEKDLEAFEAVIATLGHPTECELKQSLIRAVNIYRPGYDESAASDPVFHTQILWQRLFGKEIDVRNEIIIPGNTLAKGAR